MPEILHPLRKLACYHCGLNAPLINKMAKIPRDVIVLRGTLLYVTSLEKKLLLASHGDSIAVLVKHFIDFNKQIDWLVPSFSLTSTHNFLVDDPHLIDRPILWLRFLLWCDIVQRNRPLNIGV